MQCDEARELISPFHDGELTPEQRLAVDAHLVDCSTCADELTGFEALSGLAAKMVDPIPPANLWERIDRQIVPPLVAAGAPSRSTRRSTRRIWTVALPALLLVGVSLIVARFQWRAEDHRRSVNLDRYLTEFAADPAAAQRRLTSKYENREVDVREAAAQLRTQPIAAGPLPDGVTVKMVRVFEMPCCRCAQTVCTVDGKQTVVVFEHADEHSFEFGARPSMTCQCRGRKTRIVQFDGRLVASWTRGRRQLTLVGARDLNQVVRFVERLE
ncbi:MAG: anti-sigma factor family protein [Planctomycetaceae bacterium]